MRSRSMFLGVLMVPVIAMLPGAARTIGDPIEFEEAKFYIEFNETDDDVGVQLFLDGDPWKSVKLIGPDGNRLLHIDTRSSLNFLGLAELFFESNEPNVEDLSLDEFLALFPEGNYRLVGRTVEGERIVGDADFTHAIPDAPVIIRPDRGERVDPRNVVIEWEDVADPPGSEIIGYQVIVEHDDEVEVIDIKVRADVTKVSIPREFLRDRTDYEFEILSIEAGGNQTIRESNFRTTQ